MAASRQETVKRAIRPVKNLFEVLPSRPERSVLEDMIQQTVVRCIVPSALERYGAGFDDEPPSCPTCPRLMGA